jgi:hypothetical protein
LRNPRQPYSSGRVGKSREGFCGGRLVDQKGVYPATKAFSLTKCEMDPPSCRSVKVDEQA